VRTTVVSMQCCILRQKDANISGSRDRGSRIPQNSGLQPGVRVPQGVQGGCLRGYLKLKQKIFHEKCEPFNLF
jgi:hypothetical protein